MKIIAGLGLIIAFAGWLIYHGLIKRDIASHKSELYIYGFLSAVWILIFSLLYW